MTHRSIVVGVVRLSLLGAVAGFLGACGGMTIQNTSDHDVSFVQHFEGGDTTHTLRPGSTMDLPRGSRVRMQDFVIEEK